TLHPMTGGQATLRAPGHLALPQPAGQVERVELVVGRGLVRTRGHSGEAWSSAHWSVASGRWAPLPRIRSRIRAAISERPNRISIGMPSISIENGSVDGVA